MNRKEMQRAGALMRQLSWTDEELVTVVEASELVVAYFKERGDYFGIITSITRQELERLNSFMYARKLK